MLSLLTACVASFVEVAPLLTLTSPPNPPWQFHALALIHQIRQSDRLAVSKLVSSLTRGTARCS